ncbi:MAG: hypothetical protein DCC75_09245 [Proteobacteria bacterium]|nr:MAG: hypothetical protein DCC75_09245 [Pseudomonadota bacterium]
MIWSIIFWVAIVAVLGLDLMAWLMKTRKRGSPELQKKFQIASSLLLIISIIGGFAMAVSAWREQGGVALIQIAGALLICWFFLWIETEHPRTKKQLRLATFRKRLGAAIWGVIALWFATAWLPTVVETVQSFASRESFDREEAGMAAALLAIPPLIVAIFFLGRKLIHIMDKVDSHAAQAEPSAA